MKSKMEINSLGDKVWTNSQGQLHNEEGPAVISANGTQAWYIHGNNHREEGPAMIWDYDVFDWYINGKRVL